MADLLQVDKLQLLFVAVVPGFVSLKIWGLVNPTSKMKVSDFFVDVICYSFLNFAALFWLIPIANKAGGFLSALLFILILLIFPAIWPVLIKQLLSAKWLRGKALNPTSKAWDYFFGRAEPCFMLIHLKNGKMIGGRYYADSYASAYPETQDLYLAEVWRIDAGGRFQTKIPQTKGLLINYDIVDYIELFNEN